MKTTLIAILILLSGAFTANAQMDKQSNQQSMGHQQMMMSGNQQGMMGNMGQMPGMRHQMMMGMHGNNMMMQNMPMRRYMMMINWLPTMQNQLNLTSDQTKQLIDLKAQFEKQKVDLWAELSKQQSSLNDLLNNEASTDEIQAQLQKCADIRVKIQVKAYETAMQMRKQLNEEQKTNSLKMMNINSGMMNTNPQMMMQRKGQSGMPGNMGQ